MKDGWFRRLSLLLGAMLIVVAMVVTTGCATTPTGEAQPTAAAQPQESDTDRDYILIGRPNTVTGVLAGFGEGTPWAEERALAAVNKDGGIFIEELGKKLPVKIKVVDTESNPTKAAEVAGKLILDDKVDIMMPLHTPLTVNPVSAACERYEVPCISLDAPVEAWLTGGPYDWSYHAFWTVDSCGDLFIDMWDQAREKDPSINKTVGYLLPNDADGMTWADVMDEKLPKLDYKMIDPGRFPPDTKDYSSIINKFKEEDVDILFAVIPNPDFSTFMRQSKQQAYSPKVILGGKAMLFPSDAAALGDDMALGIINEMWWGADHPFKSSLTGETCKEICDAWTAETKRQWSQPLGFHYAGIEIVADVLTRAASLDKYKIKEAIEQTDLATVVGHIKYNDQNYSLTALVGGQWVKGEEWPWDIKVINNGPSPEVAVQKEYDLLPN